MKAKKKNTPKVKNVDLLISGGGIAGLALAAILGKQGVHIGVIDPQAPAPLKETDPSGRTVALMEASLNVLRAAGLADIIDQYGTPLEVMRLVDDSVPGQDTISHDFEAIDIDMDRFGMNIPNSMLRAALFEALHKIENVDLFVPAVLHDYTVEGETLVHARLEDGTEIRTPLIVGADGRKSVVRALADIECRSFDYGQSAITCIINHSRSHNFTSTEFHRPGGPLALVPMAGNQCSIVWVEKTEKADALLALPRDDFERTLQDLTNNILGGITLETNPQAWPLSSIRAKNLIGERVALIAEAAHVMSPITAQGLNLSLRDVAALAETVIDAMRLGADQGSAAVLKTYAGRRKLDVATRVIGVDFMNRIVRQERLPVKDLRRAGLKVVTKIQPVKDLAMHLGLAPSLDQGRLVQGQPL